MSEKAVRLVVCCVACLVGGCRSNSKLGQLNAEKAIRTYASMYGSYTSGARVQFEGGDVACPLSDIATIDPVSQFAESEATSVVALKCSRGFVKHVMFTFLKDVNSKWFLTKIAMAPGEHGFMVDDDVLRILESAPKLPVDGREPPAPTAPPADDPDRPQQPVPQGATGTPEAAQQQAQVEQRQRQQRAADSAATGQQALLQEERARVADAITGEWIAPEGYFHPKDTKTLSIKHDTSAGPPDAYAAVLDQPGSNVRTYFTGYLLENGALELTPGRTVALDAARRSEGGGTTAIKLVLSDDGKSLRSFSDTYSRRGR